MKKEFMLKLALAFTVLLLLGCGPEEETKEMSTEDNSSRIIKEIQDCEDCPVMVLIPKGHFMMGALPYDKEVNRFEIPRNSVEIKQDFYMGKYEVTYGQYTTCVREGGCDFMPVNIIEDCLKRMFRCKSIYWRKGLTIDINRLPVVGVSYNDAMKYITWLSMKAGQEYRLPTEEEWEYASRGGTDAIYWWGDKMESGRVVCSGCDAETSFENIPLYVGSFPPNPFGLHDMLGNATEMVEGCLMKKVDKKDSHQSKLNLDKCPLRRVTKGGTWSSPVSMTRPSYRAGLLLKNRYKGQGFRLVRNIDTVSLRR